MIERSNSPWLIAAWPLAGASMMAIAAGCVAREPLAAWKQETARYIQRVGDGDPASLRLLPTMRSRSHLRPDLVVIGATRVRAPEGVSRNALGVHVGAVDVDAITWHVFLVGIFDDVTARGWTDRLQPDMRDIRLVAMDARRGETDFLVSPPDHAMVERYAKRPRLVESSPKCATALTYAFPDPTDDYSMTMEGAIVTVRERRSGAEWRLSLRERAFAQGGNR